MPATILIVEDELHIQQFLAMVLTQAGYQVALAQHGAQALHLLEQQPPDLILADIMMPVMDGVRLCQQVQAHPEHHALPIILMSAYVASDSIDNCMPTAYLAQPFTVEELLAELSLALQPPDNVT